MPTEYPDDWPVSACAALDGAEERVERAEANNVDLIVRYEAERAPIAARIAELEQTMRTLRDVELAKGEHANMYLVFSADEALGDAPHRAPTASVSEKQPACSPHCTCSFDSVCLYCRAGVIPATVDTDTTRTPEQLRVCNALRERDGLPPLVPARLDADRTAKPLTENVGVFPAGKKNFYDNAEALIHRDIKPEKRSSDVTPRPPDRHVHLPGCALDVDHSGACRSRAEPEEAAQRSNDAKPEGDIEQAALDFARVFNGKDSKTEDIHRAREALFACAPRTRSEQRVDKATSAVEKPFCDVCGEEDSDDRIGGKVEVCRLCWMGLEHSVDVLKDLLDKAEASQRTDYPLAALLDELRRMQAHHALVSDEEIIKSRAGDGSRRVCEAKAARDHLFATKLGDLIAKYHRTDSATATAGKVESKP